MTKATHNGTCQVCGRAHAYNNGTIAKHGYTVRSNYFQGVCHGSDNAPLEIAKDLTIQTIKQVNAEAARLNAINPQSIKKVPVWVKENKNSFGRFIREQVLKTRSEWELTLAIPTSYGRVDGNRTFEEAQEDVVSGFKREAKFLIQHGEMLTARILTVHGEPLQLRELNIERIREEFDKMADAYARAAELKLSGWKARVVRRNYETHTTLTATR